MIKFFCKQYFLVELIKLGLLAHWSLPPKSSLRVKEAKSKIIETIEEDVNKEIITKEEFGQMNHEFKDQAKFYYNFKVHKTKDHNTI